MTRGRGVALKTSDWSRWRTYNGILAGVVIFLVGGAAIAAPADSGNRLATIATATAVVSLSILALVRWKRSGVYVSERGIEIRRLGPRRLLVWADIKAFESGIQRDSFGWFGPFLRMSQTVGVTRLRDGEAVPLPSIVWDSGLGRAATGQAREALEILEGHLAPKGAGTA